MKSIYIQIYQPDTVLDGTLNFTFREKEMSNFTIASILNLNPIKITQSRTGPAQESSLVQSRENDINLNNTVNTVNTVNTQANFTHIAHQILQRSMSFPHAIPPALKVRPQNHIDQNRQIESQLMIDESSHELDVNMNGNKKKRGRKKGSKNKPKDPNQLNAQKKVKRTKSENGKIH